MKMKIALIGMSLSFGVVLLAGCSAASTGTGPTGQSLVESSKSIVAYGQMMQTNAQTFQEAGKSIQTNGQMMQTQGQSMLTIGQKMLDNGKALSAKGQSLKDDEWTKLGQQTLVST